VKRRSASELDAGGDGEGPGGSRRFGDPGLQALHERGLLDEVVAQLQSGKEATVYTVRGPAGLMAAKIYADLATRAFKNDRLYSAGRCIADRRIEKAFRQNTSAGRAARGALWLEEEYVRLGTMRRAGVAVPRPIAREGRVLLMEFIGGEDGPAPRLSEAQLSPDDASRAWIQSVYNLGLILRAGFVHGDYSTFNLLWWQGRVIVIDLPQVVELSVNRAARDLLRRDCQTLCSTFRRLGIAAEPERAWRSAWAIARSPGLPVVLPATGRPGPDG
jgi:RIO kinase 1